MKRTCKELLYLLLNKNIFHLFTMKRKFKLKDFQLVMIYTFDVAF